MQHRARRIIEAVLISIALIIGFMVLSMVALCLTTFFSHYVRRFVFAMNDEAVPQSGDEEEATVTAAGGGQGSRGLDKGAIEELPIVEYEKGKMKGGGAGEECGVCLADFDEKERVRLLPWCHHCFHPHCIDTWLSKHSTCPLCRRPAPPPPPPLPASTIGTV